MRRFSRDTWWAILTGITVAAFMGVVISMVAAQTDRVDRLDASADSVLASTMKLVEQNAKLRKEIAALKRKLTPKQSCVAEYTFGPTSTTPVVICTMDQDYAVIPALGRYILLRGMGCGETFEDSYLVFKTRQDANAFIVSTICSEEKQDD